MQKGIYLLLLFCSLSISACGQCCQNKGCSSAQSSVATTKDGKIAVLYFHGKQRCASCIAIEKVVNDMASCPIEGVDFRVVDMTTAEGKALSNQLEVSYSSLLVGNRNLTSEAFRYARSNPEELKRLIRQAIAEQR